MLDLPIWIIISLLHFFPTSPPLFSSSNILRWLLLPFGYFTTCDRVSSAVWESERMGAMVYAYVDSPSSYVYLIFFTLLSWIFYVDNALVQIWFCGSGIERHGFCVERPHRHIIYKRIGRFAFLLLVNTRVNDENFCNWWVVERIL